MKKTLTLIAIAGMFSFYACGPSKEEMEKKAKATADSIAAAETAAAEAAAAIEQAKQDSIKAVEAAMAVVEQAKQDSIAAAEAAKGKKGAKKTPAQKIEQEAKKATSGRG